VKDLLNQRARCRDRYMPFDLDRDFARPASSLNEVNNDTGRVAF
jgi:hypothetical protein